jgi:hypothetical protein
MVERGYQPRTSFDWKAPEPLRRLTLNKEDTKIWLERIHSAWEAARTNLVKSQKRQQLSANRKRRPVNFDIGDQVMITTKHWGTGQPSRKLDMQANGPYRIKKRVGNSFELDLPDGINVHPVFSAEKLRRATTTEPLPGQLEEPAEPIEVNGQDEWVVEKVLDARIRWKKLYYRIK